jgi:hypothetical protein
MKMWRPLSEAPTLNSFADRAYILLGMILLFILGIAYLSTDLLSEPIASLPPPIVQIFEAAPQAFEDIPELPLGFPISAAVFLLYLCLGLLAKFRRLAGNATANIVLRMAGVFIDAGEWCIRNRWGSVMIILALLVFLGFNVSLLVEQHAEVSVVKEQFGRWSIGLEILLAKTTLDGSEDANFEQIADRWDDRFPLILSPEEVEVARSLQKIISDLHQSWPDDWITHLTKVLPKFDALIEDAENNTRFGRRSIRAEKLLRTAHVLLGRLWVRQAGDDCSSVSSINRALSHFKKASYLDRTATLSNALGNVYNCAAQALIKASDGNEYAGQSLKTICPDLSTCLSQAVRLYKEAAEGAEDCSFEAKRYRNNLLDLKMKLALVYDDYNVRKAAVGELRPWLGSPESLATSIKEDITNLLACNSYGNTIPIVFVTASHAFGARSLLLSEGSKERLASLKAAGAYLRLAMSMRPRDFERWHLACFCSASSNKRHWRAFLQGYNSLPGLAEDISRVSGAIDYVCS